MYEQEKSEIRTLKSYLLTQIPTTPLPPSDVLLSPNSVALKAAIAGLDKELARLEREERLVKKFTANNAAAAAEGAAAKKDEDADMEYVQMTKEDAAGGDAKMDGDKDEEEWEEANPSPAKKQQLDHPNENAEFCQKLASSAVARIANADVKVASPIGALGLALHAALLEVSDQNGDPVFKCTGVPDADVASQFLSLDITGKKGGGGFAPPVRELPQGQLVPPKWEDTAGVDVCYIAFRYKCGKEVYSTSCMSHTNDSSTVYLALKLLPDNEVAVVFGTLPSSNAESRKQLKFPPKKHVNVDGFSTAKNKNGGGSVSPTLFYVSLSELLAEFSSTFEVLTEQIFGDATEMPLEPTEKKVPIIPLGYDKSQVNHLQSVIPPDGVAVDTDPHRDPLRVMDSQRPRGDFDADLLPGGPQPGGLHGIPSSGGGMQVGPNHPMFFDNGADDFGAGPPSFGPPSFGVPGVGGMDMRPRFDPFGPPGGPTEPGRGGRFPGRGSRLGRGRGRGRGGRVPPGGSGNPNPDHMPPPGGDYFS